MRNWIRDRVWDYNKQEWRWPSRYETYDLQQPQSPWRPSENSGGPGGFLGDTLLVIIIVSFVVLFLCAVWMELFRPRQSSIVNRGMGIANTIPRKKLTVRAARPYGGTTHVGRSPQTLPLTRSGEATLTAAETAQTPAEADPCAVGQQSPPDGGQQFSPLRCISWYYQFSPAGIRKWTQVDDNTWYETYPPEPQIRDQFQVVGSTTIVGVHGVIAYKTSMPNFQVFIPDEDTPKPFFILMRWTNDLRGWMALGKVN